MLPYFSSFKKIFYLLRLGSWKKKRWRVKDEFCFERLWKEAISHQIYFGGSGFGFWKPWLSSRSLDVFSLTQKTFEIELRIYISDFSKKQC